MRILVQHHTHYRYREPASLGPHVVRLRPTSHTKAKVLSYGLSVEQPCTIKWQQDPYGNHLARVTFEAGTRVPSFDVGVEIALEVKPVNPFDFYADDRAKKLPFEYPPELRRELAPFLSDADPAARGGKRFAEFVETFPRKGDTVDAIVEANQRVNRAVDYVIREEAGVWTPEETLERGRGSCRDSGMLLVAALRTMGLAARFVSGYLVQLADEGMIPDQPKGVERDVVDLHAWAEVYLPGAGWIGLDATSGLFTGEGHIPLVCASSPALASPIEGTADQAADDIAFEMNVGRIGHETRPTAPYAEEVWHELLEGGRRADTKLVEAGLRLTAGGEPTFNAREGTELPEWNTDALGCDKWRRGLDLTRELRSRLSPQAATLYRMGKHYPGEPLPRWALDIIGRRDGKSVWEDVDQPTTPTLEAARRVMAAIGERLGLGEFVLDAREDPWRTLQEEEGLPVDVDPLQADLSDPLERRRLAKILERGIEAVVGLALPLDRAGGVWRSEPWKFRRGHLFLIPGDSPMGLRLPLKSLPDAPAPWPVDLEAWEGAADPRRADSPDYQLRLAREAKREGREAPPGPPDPASEGFAVRKALCVEPRGDELFVFLPPLDRAEDFFELVRAVDDARRAVGTEVQLEGYPPAPSPEVYKLSVTPDPGVLEVNVPPTETTDEYSELMHEVFDAALHAGLHSEKYLVDGRQAGSGGGHHVTLGGPSPLRSPFATHPSLLGSLLTFVQHHPSLSYLFTGLFVGPTSQAPRVDEARQDSLYEMEIALERAFEHEPHPPPWLGDFLFRHLLVDVSGNTHRAEICIDKLFDPSTPHGRQGLLELRAFEMPPHVRMCVAQTLLARALVASFTNEPYRAPLARYGQVLHDRFLLPHWMWKDFEDVLAHLERSGSPLPTEAYRPFLELRCPVVGRLEADDVLLEIRNAIEPWHVLGEEATAGGTSRYVDSSMERVEVRAEGLVPERHVVVVNGRLLPMRSTGRAQEHVGGVRFRAWAPPHALHPHLGIHHPLHFDVIDTWAKRSLGACGYHVWHPEGQGYTEPPLTRFEASARRQARFTMEPTRLWPVEPDPTALHPDAPYCIDLRRHPMDRPMPDPADEDEDEDEES